MDYTPVFTTQTITCNRFEHRLNTFVNDFKLQKIKAEKKIGLSTLNPHGKLCLNRVN